MTEAQVLSADNPAAIEQATAVLRRGGLVAFPTDTVYGLAADVWNPQPIIRIYQVKGRPELKAIPVLLPDFAALPQVVQPQPDNILEIARRYWPGPLTLVLKRLPTVPAGVSSTDSIGVRVPDHAFALQLLASTGALAVTSANRSGGQSARTASEVQSELGDQIDLIVDGGRTPGGVPSTVVDCTADPPRLLRQGPITLDAILRLMAETGGFNSSAKRTSAGTARGAAPSS